MATKKAAAKQRSTVVGVFPRRDDALEAVNELKRAGFREDEISLVGKNAEGDVQTEGNNAGTGAVTGAVVGAGAAALASLGMAFGVIPIIGPVLAMGPLGAALVSAAGGAAAGGLVGGLIGMGVPEDEAKYYEGEVQSGRYLVTVNAPSRYDEAWTILHRRGAYNQQTAATAPAAASTCATQGTAAHTATASTTGEGAMRLHEEQLHAHKQPVQTGEARVRKEVVTEHRTMDVPVTREEVVIERHPVSGQAASSGDIRPGEEVRIPVREEQVRVEKEAVAKEEVHVGKRKVQDTEQVGGTVRREEIRVEQQGDVDIHRKDAGKKGNKDR